MMSEAESQKAGVQESASQAFSKAMAAAGHASAQSSPMPGFETPIEPDVGLTASDMTHLTWSFYTISLLT